MAELSLSEVQAVHILDMQLRRLTALAKLELEREAAELRGRIDELEKLLASEPRRKKVVLSELEELVSRFGRSRRSTLVSPDQLDDVTLADAVAEERAARIEEPCVMALSHSAVLGREPVEGPRPATFGRHDTLVQRVATTTHSQIFALTAKARVFPIEVDAVAEVTGRSRGTPIAELVALDKGEQVLALVAPPPGTDDHPPPVLVVTAQGVMKRIDVTEIAGTPSGRTAMKLRPGDSVVAAVPAPDGTEVIAVASNAQAMRCAADAVPVQGRGAGGVAGMKLAEGATVVGAGMADEEAVVLTVSDAQTAKVTDAEEIPLKGRNTAGVRVTRFRKEKRLEWAHVGGEQGLLVVPGQADAPTKPDATAEPVTLPHTARDLVGKPTRRRWLGVGFGRW
jgi:DNA gyrase subunit A